MKLNVCLVAFALGVQMGCASHTNRMKPIDTELQNSQPHGAGSVGLNENDELVFRRKVRLLDYMKGLEAEVYELESEVYGHEKWNRKGLYGVLRDCQDEARSKKLGGDGKVAQPLKKSILTKGEDVNFSRLYSSDALSKTAKVGIDEKKQIVAIEDDYLVSRIKRFEGYKEAYAEQKERYQEYLRICDAEVKSKNYSSQIEVSEAGSSVASNLQDVVLCNYVDYGASMKQLVEIAVKNNWLNREQLAEMSSVNEGVAKDSSGFERNRILNVGDWRLSYSSWVSFGDLQNGVSDARLEAWMHRNSGKIPNSSACLPKTNGRWNVQRQF